MTQRLINLTPHGIDVLDADGVLLVHLPPSGLVARVDPQVLGVDNVVVEGAAVPIRTLRNDTVDGLPDPDPAVRYVVSRTLAAFVRRPDLLVVDQPVRDAAGQVIGCRGLAVVEPRDPDPSASE